MRIAGVYASAFLFFIFYFKCTEMRNSNKSHPGIYFRIGVSPHNKNKFIHNSKLNAMKKINEIALINSVSLNEKLYKFNEENETFRISIRVTYSVSDVTDDNSDKDLLSLSAFADAGAVVGKSYTCILNFDRVLEGEKHTEKAQDEALKELVKKFVGKKARFSTFDFTISELTGGKEKSITDGTHTYSSLANTYLGNVDDVDAEFKKLKIRLEDMIDDNFDYTKDDDD